jgi:putative hydrolase of the HAD superfamily
MIDIIAFDADDTLWHNEINYLHLRDICIQILSRYHPPEEVAAYLDHRDVSNVEIFGYGIKSYVLSMIETATEMTAGNITTGEIKQFLEQGKAILKQTPELIDGVIDCLTTLVKDYPMMIITKGEQMEQGDKVNRSGLVRYFRHIEIVSEKTPPAYQALLDRYEIDPSRFLMVGNSIKSDIIPVLKLGSQAVHVPYPYTWFHEHVTDEGRKQYDYYELKRISQLPKLIKSLER